MPHRYTGPTSAPWRALGGILLAVVLSVLALPTLHAGAAESAEVESGTFSWAVKDSFRDYITGSIAHGSISATSPADDNKTRTTFREATGTWSPAAASVTARGGVRFVGHEGKLDVTLRDPQLVVDGSGARLLVDATDSDGVVHTDLAMATVDLTGAVTAQGTSVVIVNARATLTKAGETVFNYDGSPMYLAGDALAPINATLKVTSTGGPTTPPTSPPTTTPPTTAPPTTAPTTPPVSAKGPLTWGVKETFRRYVPGPIAKGTVTLAGGVSRTNDGAYRWPWKSAAGNNVDYTGSVRFAGHHGELDVLMTAPRITVTSKTTATLSLDVNGRRTVVASVSLNSGSTSRGVVSFTRAPVRLVASGVPVFSRDGSPFYDAGTELDPASFQIAASVSDTATSNPEPTRTPRPTKGPDATPTDGVTTAGSHRAGALSWGVKSSFRSYIAGPIAKGSISVSGGAAASGGTFRFGQGSTTATPPAALGTTTYTGTVRFQGHHNVLDIALTQPTVRVNSASSATLSAQVAGRGRVEVATLNLGAAQRSSENGWVQYAGVPATLTAAGSRLFVYNGSSFYPAGTAVDPVTFSIGAAGGVSGGGSGGSSVVDASDTDWTPPATPPATTGVTLEQDQVRAGEEITATASGFTPGETGIRVVLYSTPLVLADDVRADANGVASWTGKIPATLAAGEHTLTFQGSVNRGAVIEVAAAETIQGCVLSNGRIDWGFKESFRAYVSGSIANGDWSTTGNAGYRTPAFNWTKGTGVRDDKSGAGSLEFTGRIQFVGHDGALDTRVANPVIIFSDADSAVLSLDYSGTQMEAAMAGKEELKKQADVPFADLDLAAGTLTRDGDTVTITDIPTRLTVAGNAVFPNYEAGAEMDPMTLTFTTTQDCATAATGTDNVAPEADEDVVAAAASSSAGRGDWFPWIGGGLMGAVLACGATILVMRRRMMGAHA